MVGVLPISFSLEKKPQAHGYTVVEVLRQNPFYPRRTVLKGHEFHYSRAMDFEKKKGVTFAFVMKRGQGIMRNLDGICYRNVLATYTHLHAYGAHEWAEGLIRKAVMYKKKRGRNV